MAGKSFGRKFNAGKGGKGRWTFQMGKGWREYMSATEAKAFRRKFARHRRKALNLVASDILDLAIQSGSFAKNADLTVSIKGGSTPLRDRGQLLAKSLKTVMVNQYSIFVGVPESSKNYRIARALHDGATIPVTARMRQMFFALWAVSAGRAPASMLTGRAAELYKRKSSGWYPLASSTKVIRIPGRPYMKEAFDGPRAKATAIQMFSQAVDRTIAEMSKGSR